jgi:hypothetical protein
MPFTRYYQECSKQKLKWAWHAESTETMRNAHRIEEPESKKSFLRPSLDLAIILKLK